MPVNIPRDLPARRTLEDENVFVMSDERAHHQDIRPLKIAILNLMPTKVATETHLLRLLGNTPLQLEITLLHMGSHESKNTSTEHLETFYATFPDVREEKFDGLVITGAPVEMLEFTDVDYWPELVEVMEWSRRNVFSTLHVCWGAQAALYHHYAVPKHALDEKMFGVFSHHLHNPHARILSGFDEGFFAPHSRHTTVLADDLRQAEGLELLVTSEEAGVYLAISTDGREVFVTGHPEYDPDTLQLEYERDVARGLPIEVPRHYYPDDDPSRAPLVTWRSHAFLLYANWLNYCVYQRVPFDRSAIPAAMNGTE
ncbi:MAG: homoserine O-succinyltransferase [Actinomycetales bacterium]